MWFMVLKFPINYYLNLLENKTLEGDSPVG